MISDSLLLSHAICSEADVCVVTCGVECKIGAMEGSRCQPTHSCHLLGEGILYSRSVINCLVLGGLANELSFCEAVTLPPLDFGCALVPFPFGDLGSDTAPHMMFFL
jgi:hypothetical protein